ncbi:hypothetical protein Pmani_019639 [Petrolisthes manimaculis]|uniref:Condensin complex subunit 2 n=1 Tax=Petrolisthes manimaculis TaxID=1843537 RepID=A0AAE1U3C9_9EUCA|nr:hypothetical protein Pmani_019639 [Petrolisthes manimaculis]
MKPNRRSSVGFALSPTKRRSSIMPPPDTPRSRRQSLAIAEVSGESFLDVPENNDEKEKKERQLNRLQKQIQSRKFSSPGTSSAGTPGQVDRRKSLSMVAGLTNQQLSEHYSTCIQLSAENKISVKNAFSLQLIDYMSEMLRRKDSDLNNFQVASCTLDASTKIYAYRVDSIHTDTLKMAGGLGRTQEKKGNRSDQEDQDVGDEKNDKRKRRVKKKVIETNLKNLNVAKFDLEFEVDPLFKKTASQFDEGRSGSGIFLNTLMLQDDSCLLMLDSESVILNSGVDTGVEPKTETIQIPRPGDFSQALICPTFSSFEFTSWKLSDDNSISDTSCLEDTDNENRPENNSHRFDINAVPEPIDNDAEFYGDECYGGGEEDCEDGTVMTIGQEGCQQAHPPLMEAVHLKEYLAKNHSEYSYFDTQLMSAWAGPSHWRMRPLSKVKNKSDSKEEGKKKKKEFVTVNYVKEDMEKVDPEIDKLFAVTRKAIQLSQNTLKTWSKDNTTLPLDLHYEAQNFFKLSGRSAIVIRRQKEAAEVNESISAYDYDNEHDKDNYCADVDDAGSGYGDNTAPGYDVTDLFSQTVMGTQPCATDDPDNVTNFMDNLVAAPNKVAKLSIAYARTAKKIDMKKLKVTMWDMLADSTNNKENEKQQENQSDSTPSSSPITMDPNHNQDFSVLYKTLPSKLSTKMSENLSVPLAFIALLHLANEHNLELIDQGNLMDFKIMQG